MHNNLRGWNDKDRSWSVAGNDPGRLTPPLQGRPLLCQRRVTGWRAVLAAGPVGERAPRPGERAPVGSGSPVQPARARETCLHPAVHWSGLTGLPV